ncbi:MAG: hypothetical protein IJO01_08665 [Oscillospiraceae bacterium]|nr:hypothetical protein [Oscillospiraceae bacterium]
MKQIVKLLFNDTKHPFYEKFYNTYKNFEIVSELEKNKWYIDSELKIPFYENSEEFFNALLDANSHEMKYTLFADTFYSKKEIEKDIHYFRLYPSYPTELEGTTEKNYGTVLKGGCLCCGVGSKAFGDILIDRKLVKKCKIGCLIPDYVVSKEIKEIIESNNLTGVTFEECVKDFKGRDMDDYYVMNINNILPPMSKNTWFNKQVLEDKCPICGHRTTYLRSDIRYDKESFETNFDFNLTKEYLDNDWNQYIIVSAKVRQVFKENKIRIGFKPVTLL